MNENFLNFINNIILRLKNTFLKIKNIYLLSDKYKNDPKLKIIKEIINNLHKSMNDYKKKMHKIIEYEDENIINISKNQNNINNFKSKYFNYLPESNDYSKIGKLINEIKDLLIEKKKQKGSGEEGQNLYRSLIELKNDVETKNTKFNKIEEILKKFHERLYNIYENDDFLFKLNEKLQKVIDLALDKLHGEESVSKKDLADIHKIIDEITDQISNNPGDDIPGKIEDIQKGLNMVNDFLVSIENSLDKYNFQKGGTITFDDSNGIISGLPDINSLGGDTLKISYHNFLQKSQAEYKDIHLKSTKKDFLKKIILKVINKYDGKYGDIADKVTIDNSTLGSFNNMFTGTNQIKINLVSNSQEFSMYQLGIFANILSCIEEINEGLNYLDLMKGIILDKDNFSDTWISLFKNIKPSIFVASIDGASFLYGPFIKTSEIYHKNSNKTILNFIDDLYSDNISNYMKLSIHDNPSVRGDVPEYKEKFLLGDNYDNQDINLNLIYDKLKNLCLFLKCCFYIYIEFSNRLLDDDDSNKISPEEMIKFKDDLILNYFPDSYKNNKYMHFLKGGAITSISSIIKKLKQKSDTAAAGSTASANARNWNSFLDTTITSPTASGSSGSSGSVSSVSENEIKTIAIITSLSYPNLDETDKGLNNELKKLQNQVNSTKEVPTEKTVSSGSRGEDETTDADSTGSDEISKKLQVIRDATTERTSQAQGNLKSNFIAILSNIEEGMNGGGMAGGAKDRIRIKPIVDKLKEASKQKKKIKQIFEVFAQKIDLITDKFTKIYIKNKFIEVNRKVISMLKSNYLKINPVLFLTVEYPPFLYQKATTEIKKKKVSNNCYNSLFYSDGDKNRKFISRGNKDGYFLIQTKEGGSEGGDTFEKKPYNAAHQTFFESDNYNDTDNILNDPNVGLSTLIKQNNDTETAINRVINMFFAIGPSGTGKTSRLFGLKGFPNNDEGIMTYIAKSDTNAQIAYCVFYGRPDENDEKKYNVTSDKFNECVCFFKHKDIKKIGEEDSAQHIDVTGYREKSPIEDINTVNNFNDFYKTLMKKKLHKVNDDDDKLKNYLDGTNNTLTAGSGHGKNFRELLEETDEIWYNLKDSEEDLSTYLTKIFEDNEKKQKAIRTILPTKNNIASSRGHTCVIIRLNKTDRDGNPVTRYFPLYDMAGTEDPTDVFNFYFQPGIKSEDFKSLLETINDSTDYKFHKIEKNDEEIPSFKMSQDKYKIDSLYSLFGDQKELNKSRLGSNNIVTYVKGNLESDDGDSFEQFDTIESYINDKIVDDSDNNSGKFLFKIVKEGMYINHTIASLLFAILCSSTILKSAEKTIDGIFNVDPEKAYCENVQVGLKKANIIPFKNENTELFDINNNKDAVINTGTFQIKSTVAPKVDDGASPGQTAAEAAAQRSADAQENLPSGWESARDENGDRYYYNTQTGVSAWELPLEGGYTNINNHNSQSDENSEIFNFAKFLQSMLGGQYGGGNCDEDSAPVSKTTDSTDNSTQCGINISCFTKMLIKETYSGRDTSFKKTIYNSILSQSTIWLQSIFSFLLWNEVGVSSVPTIIKKLKTAGVDQKKLQSELKELYTPKKISETEIKLIDNMTKEISSSSKININLLVNANNDFNFEDGSAQAFEYFKYKLLQKFPKLTISSNNITLNFTGEPEVSYAEKEEKKKEFKEFINKTLTEMGINSTLGITGDVTDNYEFVKENFNKIFNIFNTQISIDIPQNSMNDSFFELDSGSELIYKYRDSLYKCEVNTLTLKSESNPNDQKVLEALETANEEGGKIGNIIFSDYTILKHFIDKFDDRFKSKIKEEMFNVNGIGDSNILKIVIMNNIAQIGGLTEENILELIEKLCDGVAGSNDVEEIKKKIKQEKQDNRELDPASCELKNIELFGSSSEFLKKLNEKFKFDITKRSESSTQIKYSKLWDRVFNPKFKPGQINYNEKIEPYKKKNEFIEDEYYDYFCNLLLILNGVLEESFLFKDPEPMRPFDKRDFLTKQFGAPGNGAKDNLWKSVFSIRISVVLFTILSRIIYNYKDLNKNKSSFNLTIQDPTVISQMEPYLKKKYIEIEDTKIKIKDSRQNIYDIINNLKTKLKTIEMGPIKKNILGLPDQFVSFSYNQEPIDAQTKRDATKLFINIKEFKHEYPKIKDLLIFLFNQEYYNDVDKNPLAYFLNESLLSKFDRRSLIDFSKWAGFSFWTNRTFGQIWPLNLYGFPKIEEYIFKDAAGRASTCDDVDKLDLIPQEGPNILRFYNKIIEVVDKIEDNSSKKEYTSSSISDENKGKIQTYLTSDRIAGLKQLLENTIVNKITVQDINSLNTEFKNINKLLKADYYSTGMGAGQLSDINDQIFDNQLSRLENGECLNCQIGILRLCTGQGLSHKRDAEDGVAAIAEQIYDASKIDLTELK